MKARCEYGKLTRRGERRQGEKDPSQSYQLLDKAQGSSCLTSESCMSEGNAVHFDIDGIDVDHFLIKET